MNHENKEAIMELLFSEPGSTLVDLKCFRGSGESVSPSDIMEQIHSAIMQVKMGRAIPTQEAPSFGIVPKNVEEFVASLPATK